MAFLLHHEDTKWVRNMMMALHMYRLEDSDNLLSIESVRYMCLFLFAINPSTRLVVSSSFLWYEVLARQAVHHLSHTQ
jgi:hypothetical protein